MPWFCLTALVHCILVLEKRLLLSSWTVILSIATFMLSMSGTFLVRSGILNSVHTFANDPERGIFILIFLFTLILLSLVIFFVFYKENNQNIDKTYWLSKETSILFNNLFLMYFLSVVLIGTVYPIFLEVLSGEKISVGSPFYHKLIIPFLIPFLIFMSIGPNLNWIKSEVKKINIQIFLSFTISLLISFLILRKIGYVGLINTILILTAFYLFFITIKDFFLKKFKNYSQNFSHFGFSLLILSILFNSILSSEKIINLKVGEKFSFKEETITFESIENIEKKNYKSIVGYFKIKDKQNNSIQLKPELRIYNQPVMITSEADIKTTLYYDKFLVMNLVKDYEYFNVRYQVKPFMIWIWISTILLVIGGLLSLFKRLYEK
jgi:cytochrome c-type biogenesis protein CcmF